MIVSPPEPSFFSQMLPVVAGGMIAVFGGALQSWVAHKFSTKSSQAEVRRERLEEIVTLSNEFSFWIDGMRNLYFFDEPAPSGIDPLAKMQALSKLHFPELQAEIVPLLGVRSNYMGYIQEGLKLKHSNNGLVPKDHISKMAIHYDALYKAQDALIDRAAALLDQ